MDTELNFVEGLHYERLGGGARPRSRDYRRGGVMSLRRHDRGVSGWCGGIRRFRGPGMVECSLFRRPFAGLHDTVSVG